jgi:HK97 family phage major capsid protein
MHKEAKNEAVANSLEVRGLGVPKIILFNPERRAATATGGSNGSEGGAMVPTNLVGFIDALVAKMVLKQMGITMLTGLTGNVSIPKKTATLSAAWETETGEANETNYTFGSIALAPRRLAAWTEYTRQLLMQSSQDIEMMVRNDLALAIQLAVEQAFINGAGSGSNQPLGILNLSGIGSVAIGTNGGAPTFDHIIKLETEVMIDNADFSALGYLTNPKVRGKLKVTRTDTNNGLPVWGAEPTPLNGYKTGVTTLVPSTLDKGSSTGVCSAIIFGSFDQYVGAQFGGIDLIVDPYAKKLEGKIQVAANSYWDGNARHAQSFAAVVDATTT